MTFRRVVGTAVGVVVWSVVAAWAQSYQVVDLGNVEPADLNSQWIVGMYRPNMARTSFTLVGNSADSRGFADVTPCIATPNGTKLRGGGPAAAPPES